MANRRIYVSYSNLPRAVLQGVELSVNHRLNDKWDVFGNYTYLDAKNDVTHNRLLKPWSVMYSVVVLIIIKVAGLARSGVIITLITSMALMLSLLTHVSAFRRRKHSNLECYGDSSVE